MWWARSRAIDIYLSRKTLALRDADQPTQVRSLEAGDWAAPLQEALAANPKRRWNVWLGGRLCALHAMEPIEGVRTLEEAEAALAALLSAPETPVDARLAFWPEKGESMWVAAAMPAGLPGRIKAMVGAYGGRLEKLRPWWVAFSTSLEPDVAVCDDESLHYWRSSDAGRVRAAGSLIWSEPPSLSQILRRLRVAGPLPAWRLSLLGDSSGTSFALQPLTEETHASGRT